MLFNFLMLSMLSKRKIKNSYVVEDFWFPKQTKNHLLQTQKRQLHSRIDRWYLFCYFLYFSFEKYTLKLLIESIQKVIPAIFEYSSIQRNQFFNSHSNSLCRFPTNGRIKSYFINSIYIFFKQIYFNHKIDGSKSLISRVSESSRLQISSVISKSSELFGMISGYLT